MVEGVLGEPEDNALDTHCYSFGISETSHPNYFGTCVLDRAEVKEGSAQ